MESESDVTMFESNDLLLFHPCQGTNPPTHRWYHNLAELLTVPNKALLVSKRCKPTKHQDKQLRCQFSPLTTGDQGSVLPSQRQRSRSRSPNATHLDGLEIFRVSLEQEREAFGRKVPIGLIEGVFACLAMWAFDPFSVAGWLMSERRRCRCLIEGLAVK